MLKVIPITAEGRPRQMIKSLQTASQYLREGHLVCIFAEGEISRTGQMLPFRRGMSRIMKGVEAPVIPVHLDNVWGSIFSFEKGRFGPSAAHRLPYPVTVSFRRSMPPNTPPHDVRQAVMELGAALASAWRNGAGARACLPSAPRAAIPSAWPWRIGAKAPSRLAA